MSKTKINTELLLVLSVEKLREQIISLKKDLFNLRFQKTLGELKDNSAFSKVRKDIARVKTRLTKRKIGESK